jgi:lipoate-protein ligase A
MAVDEILFTKAQAERSTFLRFYRWERPTASIGYSQDVRRVADVELCRREGVDLVRRITGGKLVLHHHEITYALASADTETFGATLGESYGRISRGLVRGLEILGLAPRLAETSPEAYVKGTMPCFAFPARDEVEVGGRKIIGSAQKRTGAAFLQHGSIPLESDEELLRAIARPGGSEGGAGMTSLAEAVGRPVSFEEAADHLARGLAEFFAARLDPFVLSAANREAAVALEALRYANDDWTFRRPGART